MDFLGEDHLEDQKVNCQKEQEIKKKNITEIDEDLLVQVFEKFLPKNYLPLIKNMTILVKTKGK